MNFTAKYLSKEKNIHPSSMISSPRRKDKKYQHILKLILNKKSKQNPQIHKAFQTSRFKVSHSLNKCQTLRDADHPQLLKYFNKQFDLEMKQFHLILKFKQQSFKYGMRNFNQVPRFLCFHNMMRIFIQMLITCSNLFKSHL